MWDAMRLGLDSRIDFHHKSSQGGEMDENEGKRGEEIAEQFDFFFHFSISQKHNRK